LRSSKYFAERLAYLREDQRRMLTVASNAGHCLWSVPLVRHRAPQARQGRERIPGPRQSGHMILLVATASNQQLRFNLRLIVQNHVQQGIVDFNIAVVVNKAQLPKFVHEKADTRSRRADHLRKSLLADFCY
jgi:hypothetical protein